MNKKVSFLVCGTQKGGTTALAQYLNGHSGIFIPKEKEIHFFDNETINWNEPSYKNYHQHFEEADTDKLWGEATPIYMYWEFAPRRIWHYNPKMKIILILRNPISRCYSHWSMEYNRDLESKEFVQAINLEAIRARENLPFQHRVFSYIDRGYYCHQIRNIWRYFGKESTLVLRQEELQSEPNNVLQRISSFLEISSFKKVDNVKVHPGTYKEGMKESTKVYLKKVFYNEIKELELMLGWDCSEWLRL